MKYREIIKNQTLDNFMQPTKEKISWPTNNDPLPLGVTAGELRTKMLEKKKVGEKNGNGRHTVGIVPRT